MTSWTGGQYSLFRVVFSLYLAGVFAGSLPAALALVVPFGIGWWDRLAAAWLTFAVAYLYAQYPPWTEMRLLYLGAAIALMAYFPRRPYGSWERRGDPDPGASWRSPRWAHIGAWVALAAIYAGVGSAGLAFAPLALISAARPWIWLAGGAAHAWWGAWEVVLLHGLAFDPGWIPPLRAAEPETLFYDGHCGLCHRTVRFVLSEDRDAAFQFAPLQGDRFEAAVSAARRAELPDSIVVLRAGGGLLVKSEAVLYIMRRLGGLWRVLATAGALAPRAVRDGVYDRIATVRRRLFARPDQACPLLPAELRARFDS